jgi:hypothetical protein
MYLVPLLLAILVEYVYRGRGSAFSSEGVNEALSVKEDVFAQKRESRADFCVDTRRA